MNEQIPSIGRIVHYRLSADDATQIDRRRTTGHSIAVRLKTSLSADATIDPATGEVIRIHAWPAGAQAHIGNKVTEGDTFPMMITRVWGPSAESAVNGQVFLDSNDVFWATSVCVGDGPRTFSWPART